MQYCGGEVYKPLLLDTFSGAGGCTRGYQNAGFYVVGVDNRPQPRYVGDDFILDDALDILARLLRGERIQGKSGRWYCLDDFAAIHASPPCQFGSEMAYCRPGYAYPNMIDKVRELLKQAGKPYVIENVTGSRRYLNHPIMFCGAYFGLKVYRHRYFETNPFFLAPSHGPHRDNTPRNGRGKSNKGFISVAGNMGNIDYVKMAMGINWMVGVELSQAIPPAYTEFIGGHLMRTLQHEQS
jgi:DNA (cytosine-5)-methyltransferase 1